MLDNLKREFFWICAGVNRPVLRQCPTEWAKYTGIGSSILFTALMAMLSGGYAIYIVFDDIKVGTFFGVFWGSLIFYLDRFIVNTMYSDSMPSSTCVKLVSGMHRIIIAIFLGVIIFAPLELWIFEDCVNDQIYQNQVAAMQIINQQINNGMLSYQDYIATLSSDGFIARYRTLNMIAQSNNHVFWCRIFISFLFVVIVTEPILIKMMLHNGPYDDMLRAEEHRNLNKSRMDTHENNLK